MFSAIWIATALGVAGGVALAYLAGKAVLPRAIAKSRDIALFVRLAFAGTVVALLPAFFLSIAVGGTLGGAWGKHLFGALGLPSSGVPFGLAVGIALVFAVVLLSGTAIGILLGKAVVGFRQWRARPAAPPAGARLAAPAGHAMHLFRQPPETTVRRLLAAAQLPAADLTPGHLQHFFGCGSEHAPQGVVGLELCGTEALLRSLAVDENARGRGCGRALVAEAERYARARGVRRIYLLTTTAAAFFERLGYVAVTRDRAPEWIRKTAEFSALCPSGAAFMAKDLPGG